MMRPRSVAPGFTKPNLPIYEKLGRSFFGPLDGPIGPLFSTMECSSASAAPPQLLIFSQLFRSERRAY